jgi:Fe-S-cluster-containing dehydrogenase component
MSNTEYGLLIDYKYCSGCHACEVACKHYLGLPDGLWGITLFEKGPWSLDAVSDEKGKYEWEYVPVPTGLCNLCATRTVEGKKPMCVKSCLTFCMDYGPIEELSKKMLGMGNKVALYKPVA